MQKASAGRTPRRLVVASGCVGLGQCQGTSRGGRERRAGAQQQLECFSLGPGPPT